MIIFGFKRKINSNISLHLRESRRSHEEDVKHTCAASVRVGSEDGPLKLDFDGEEALGQELRFAVMPGAVNVLHDPSAAAVLPSSIRYLL